MYQKLFIKCIAATIYTYIKQNNYIYIQIKQTFKLIYKMQKNHCHLQETKLNCVNVVLL